MASRSNKGFLGWLVTILGIVFVVITLVFALLFVAPTVLGWQQLTVLTGSMEPAVPIGSMVYVESVAPEDLSEGDIVTFRKDGDSVTHRVVKNHVVEGELIVKGDANEKADPMPVPYASVMGKVILIVPFMGDVLSAFASMAGKIYLLAFGACGVMLVVLGGRLRADKDNDSRSRG